MIDNKVKVEIQGSSGSGGSRVFEIISREDIHNQLDNLYSNIINE